METYSFEDGMRGRPRRGGPPSDAWARYIPFIPWVLGALVAVLLISDFSYTVEPHEQAVVLRFGAYKATTMPGLHFKLPIVDRVMKVSVEEHGLSLPYSPAIQAAQGGNRNAIRVRQLQAEPDDDETLMLTGDLNTASVEWTVQWRVTEPSSYLFRFPGEPDDQAAADLLTYVSRTVMNRLVGDYSFDEMIGPKRGDIAVQAREDSQRILDAYDCGITVTALQMQRVIPPDRVKPSFDRVNASIQLKQKLENEAESARNKLIPEARANRDKLIREAEGYAARTKAEAQGEIEALLARYHAYERAPDVTRQRLYIEAMQALLESVKDKTIIDADLNRALPILNLNEKGEAAK
ncbi:FtsH protease activity modulator HflK [Planctomyces sp. SH-PL62]|uniref:FtsH protease activity modulator HflK n=1 Tax=Planctomyces sp. SH-PL62 TaxID=1636152 RepID=UPI00078D44D4|nr:FtsH protease activity modulator HflK [Planctomyces sp. SH-PL62]AMV39031.1 Modulator of FtsH protease HflK [Planctomyces sp. SH-PL62]